MNILGYETLRLLILTSAVFSFCAKMYIPEKDVVTFWKTGGKFVLFLRRFAYYNSKLRNEKCLPKQVCVYGFKPDALQFYCDYGMKCGKAKVEAVEDIEILRFIENGYKVQYIEVDSETVAVDTPNDLEKVRAIVAEKIASGEISNK